MIPIYAGPPLTSVITCSDFELTYDTLFGGIPIAACVGDGICTQTGSGRLFVFLSMTNNMTCPNQPVFNEVKVVGFVGGDNLFGDARGFCADNGQLRGFGSRTAGCDGFDSPLFSQVFPDACFLPPILGDPPMPGGGGNCPVICLAPIDSGCATQIDPCAYPSTGGCPPSFTSSGDGCCCGSTPILIDINGDGYNLTGFFDGVNFDLNNDGSREKLSWTSNGSDDSWLALDRNGNGRIDGGRELFGNATPQSQSPDPNGFLALAEFDKLGNGGNRDGVISQRDSVFASLLLWRDANHNGVSEPNELRRLSSSRIIKIDLNYSLSNRRDQHGNRFRYRARIYDLHGANTGRWAWDIILVASQ